MSDSPNADFFAIAVMELDEENKLGVLVHTYAGLGNLNNHVKYFSYIMTHFNVHMIICDNAGSDIFIDTCNQSDYFKNNKINIKTIDFNSDAEGDDYAMQLKNARVQYNLSEHKIAFSQVFSSSFIRKGNEYLQACIDYKKVLFASRTCSNEAFFNETIGIPLPKDLIFNAEKSEWTPLDFLENQDDYIYQTKKQCAIVECSATSRGMMNFDLPQHLRRSSSANRARKDNYSAFMLANCAVHCYNEIMSVEINNTTETFTPRMF
jgi:hypothetical protein